MHSYSIVGTSMHREYMGILMSHYNLSFSERLKYRDIWKSIGLSQQFIPWLMQWPDIQCCYRLHTNTILSDSMRGFNKIYSIKFRPGFRLNCLHCLYLKHISGWHCIQKVCYKVWSMVIPCHSSYLGTLIPFSRWLYMFEIKAAMEKSHECLRIYRHWQSITEFNLFI